MVPPPPSKALRKNCVGRFGSAKLRFRLLDRFSTVAIERECLANAQPASSARGVGHCGGASFPHDRQNRYSGLDGASSDRDVERPVNHAPADVSLAVMMSVRV
jgi:hypothetical protein